MLELVKCTLTIFNAMNCCFCLFVDLNTGLKFLGAFHKIFILSKFFDAVNLYSRNNIFRVSTVLFIELKDRILHQVFASCSYCLEREDEISVQYLTLIVATRLNQFNRKTVSLSL